MQRRDTSSLAPATPVAAPFAAVVGASPPAPITPVVSPFAAVVSEPVTPFAHMASQPNKETNAAMILHHFAKHVCIPDSRPTEGQRELAYAQAKLLGIVRPCLHNDKVEEDNAGMQAISEEQVARVGHSAAKQRKLEAPMQNPLQHIAAVAQQAAQQAAQQQQVTQQAAQQQQATQQAAQQAAQQQQAAMLQTPPTLQEQARAHANAQFEKARAAQYTQGHAQCQPVATPGPIQSADPTRPTQSISDMLGTFAATTQLGGKSPNFDSKTIRHRLLCAIGQAYGFDENDQKGLAAFLSKLQHKQSSTAVVLAPNSVHVNAAHVQPHDIIKSVPSGLVSVPKPWDLEAPKRVTIPFLACPADTSYKVADGKGLEGGKINTSWCDYTTTRGKKRKRFSGEVERKLKGSKEQPTHLSNITDMEGMEVVYDKREKRHWICVYGLGPKEFILRMLDVRGLESKAKENILSGLNHFVEVINGKRAGKCMGWELLLLSDHPNRADLVAPLSLV